MRAGLALVLLLAFTSSARAEEARLSIATGRLPNAPRVKRKYPEKLLSFFGLRPSETRVSGADVFPGLTLATESLGYFHDPDAHVNGRVSHFGMIGLERQGVEGGLGVDLTVGLFTPVARTEGLISRLGGRAHLLGNHAFYTSLVELPMLELGYQRIDRELAFDFAARGGAVLVGRYNPDGDRRRLGGSFEYGGVFSLRVAAIDLNLDFTRIEARRSEPETPIDMLRGVLCGGPRFFGVCMDARWSTGELNSPGERRTITYLGLAVGGLAR